MVQNAVEAAILAAFAARWHYSSKILPVFPTHNISIHCFFTGQELIVTYNSELRPRVGPKQEE